MNESIKLELRRIASRNKGILRPDDVVSEAANPESPLHDQFEWDDAKAAQLHRVDAARRLIRSSGIRVTETESGPLYAPEWIRSVRAEESEQAYVSTMSLKTKSKVAEETVLEEVRRIAGLIERARGIAIALGKSEFLEELIARAVDGRGG